MQTQNTHIQGKFKVENFKKFEELEIENIGQFNLIVGGNNVGKSTLLEALTFDENGYDWMRKLLFSVFCNRGVHLHDNQNKVTNYFTRITCKEGTCPIELSFNDKVISLEMINFSKLEDSLKKYIYQINPSIKPIDFILFKENEISKTAFPLEWHYFGNDFYSEKPDNFNIPFVGTKRGTCETRKNDLVDVIDRIKSSDFFEEFIKLIEIMLPNIKDIYSLPDDILPDNIRTIEMKFNDGSRKKINQIGEGTIHFIRIITEIFLAKNDRLCIDEIENGIHYSIMKDYWKTIITQCKANKVQLFASTHSYDCILGFKEALEELGEEYKNKSTMIRLFEFENKIESFTYGFKGFKAAIEENDPNLDPRKLTY